MSRRLVTWSLFAVGIAALTVLGFGIAAAQTEPLKGADREAYRQLKELKAPVVVKDDDKKTAANRKLLERQAKYIVSRLTDPRLVDDLARVIEEAVRNDLPVITTLRPKQDVIDNYLDFTQEMGAALVKELTPVVKHPKLIVRLNANRLLSVVGKMGCPKAAELALEVLGADSQPQLKTDAAAPAPAGVPHENEAVRMYALKTLAEVLGFEVNPAVPEMSVFTRIRESKTLEANRQLERRCIIFLCNLIMTPRDVSGLDVEEVDAITYCRREAVRALGCARTPRLKFGGKVLAQPAYVLLKVANADGLVPRPDMVERAEAIIGFCKLFPVVRSGADRDVECDSAAFALGAAINDLITTKVNAPTNLNLAWRAVGFEFEHATNLWQTNVAAMNLDGAPYAKALYEHAKGDLFDPLKANNPNVVPNTNSFRTWLQATPPKSPALFKDEPNLTIKPAGL